ncbi:MAG: CD1871A family CXXC motif-containing protein [Peptoniphilus sp.]|nr:CD1871A family CXXC motif-containing protein [Peptoniphilus sp.]MDY2987241.1 CD1871A family CXXC motif-containing protein [Peptoniphilus sp.]
MSAAILGVMCIMYGAQRGEVDTVLSKAIRICLECIGIG